MSALRENIRRALNTPCKSSWPGKLLPDRYVRRGCPHIVEFPNIVADAAALGVHRIHLYLVLSGRRRSHSLLRRYRALKKEAA